MDDTARAMFARLVSHYRTAKGSQHECARLTNCSVSYLSRIESGQRLPEMPAVKQLDAGLDAGGALVEMLRLLREARRKGTTLDTEPDDYEDDVEGDGVERRQLLTRVLGLTGAAGLAGPLAHVEAVRRTLDYALDRSVDAWEEIAWDYGRDVLIVPPEMLLDELTSDALAVRQLLSRHMPHAQGDSLYLVAARLSALVAMTLGNLGHVDHGRRWWRTAAAAADRTGDHELRVWVRGRRAVQGLYDEGSPEDAVQLADRALALAGDEHVSGRASGLAARAQALALMGDPKAADAVDEIASVFEELPHAVVSDGTSVYGWPEQRLRHVQSHVFSCAGDRRAPAAHEAALALYPRGRYIASAQIELHRAGWLVRTGDAEEGVAHATCIIAGLPANLRDHMVEMTARDFVLRPAPSGQRASAATDELRELLVSRG